MESAFLHKVVEVLGQRRQQRLPDCLQTLAKLLARLPEVRGAALLVYDRDGESLSFGHRNLPLVVPPGDAPLQVLDRLEPELRACTEPGLCPIPPGFFAAPRGVQLRAFPTTLPAVREPAASATVTPVGFVVVATDDSPAAERATATIQSFAALCHLPIRDAVTGEAIARITRLRDVVRDLDGTPASIDYLLGELRTIFDADVVTLFLERHRKLRLAASTDATIDDDGPVVYLPDEPQLTSHVFRTRRSLRLPNTRDAAAVQARTGLARADAKHPERTLSGTTTVQFLAAPLRRGQAALGVLRVSRAADSNYFTSEDETALQIAADVLGTYFADRVELTLSRGVFDSGSESIIASVREELDGGEGAWDRIVWASKGAEKLTGRTRDELLALDAKELYPQEQVRTVRDALLTTLDDQRDSCGPHQIGVLLPDGTVRPIEITFRLIEDDTVRPPNRYVVGISRDLSERQGASAESARVLSLLDKMGVAHFIASDHTIKTSKAESDITGYSGAELKAPSFRRNQLHYEPGSRKQLIEKARKAPDRRLNRQLLKFRRKDGEAIYVEADIVLLNDEEPVEVEGLYRDVTGRVKMQKFFEIGDDSVLAEDELLHRLQAFAKFNVDYLISFRHQVITPLASVREALIDIRTSVRDRPRLDQVLGQLLGRIRVCIDLLENQVYLDRILRGKTFDKHWISITKLAIDVKIDFDYKLKEEEIWLDIEPDASDVYGMGNQGLLYQVVVNLVDNAIKYSFRRSTINVRVRENKSNVVLEIDNEGLRIPPQDRERVFEQAYRGRKAQARVPDGTGLGLWLARRIMQLHDGTITCNEVITDGRARTLFRVSFPKRPSPQSRGSS